MTEPEAIRKVVDDTLVVMRRRSVHSIAKAILLGEDYSEEELLMLAKKVAGPKHLDWEGRAACNKNSGPKGNKHGNVFLTSSLSDVECGQCRRTQVFGIAAKVAEGVITR